MYSRCFHFFCILVCFDEGHHDDSIVISLGYLQIKSSRLHIHRPPLLTPAIYTCRATKSPPIPASLQNSLLLYQFLFLVLPLSVRAWSSLSNLPSILRILIIFPTVSFLTICFKPCTYSLIIKVFYCEIFGKHTLFLPPDHSVLPCSLHLANSFTSHLSSHV